MVKPCSLAAALAAAALAAATLAVTAVPAHAQFGYMSECGSIDELCCFGDGGLPCDDGLACDGNVQALLGPGICRECGAVDEIPCEDGTCGDGLEAVSNEFDLSICVDPTGPPPSPCGATGEPCCRGLNIPFDNSGCDEENLCAFVEGSPDGVCERCGATGEQCCVIQSDDILTLECSEGNVCGTEGPTCVTCGEVGAPPCTEEGVMPCNEGLEEVDFLCQAPVEPKPMPEPTPVTECCSADLPICCSGVCITLKDAAAASCLVGATCCDGPESVPDPVTEPEPTPVDECCSPGVPICCSGTCITLEDAAAASCLAGAACCNAPEPVPEPDEAEGAGVSRDPDSASGMYGS